MGGRVTVCQCRDEIIQHHKLRKGQKMLRQIIRGDPDSATYYGVAVMATGLFWPAMICWGLVPSRSARQIVPL